MCYCLLDIWSEQSFQTDPDLPPGWKKITDMAGIYYWHIPTGTTQWERPSSRPPLPGQTESPAPADHTASTPRKRSLGSLSPSPTPDHEVRDTETNSCSCLVNFCPFILILQFAAAVFVQKLICTQIIIFRSD